MDRTGEIHNVAMGINARTSALLALLLLLPCLLRISNQSLSVVVYYVFLLLVLLSLQCSPVEDTICNSANESRVTNDLGMASTGARKQSFWCLYNVVWTHVHCSRGHESESKSGTKSRPSKNVVYLGVCERV
jgi:hypothetical protein